MKSQGRPRLVAVQPLPTVEGLQCPWAPAGSLEGLVMASLQHAAERASGGNAAGVERPAEELDPAPVRVLEDEYATYSAVAVDPVRNEIAIQDENLFQILIFDRMANTPPSATMTEPKRILTGPATKIEFNCGLYIDPSNGDLYSVNNDTTDTESEPEGVFVGVWSINDDGDIPPQWKIAGPNSCLKKPRGVAMNPRDKELIVADMRQNAILTYYFPHIF